MILAQREGVLLKANGDRKRWNYRWSAHWGYTYWRPSGAVISPAGALEAGPAEVEEEVEPTIIEKGVPAKVTITMEQESARAQRWHEPQGLISAAGGETRPCPEPEDRSAPGSCVVACSVTAPCLPSPFGCPCG